MKNLNQEGSMSEEIKPEQNESKRKWEYTRYADIVIKVKEEY